MRNQRRRLAGVSVVTALVGAVPLVAGPAVGAEPDAKGWESDLAILAGMIMERHPNPFEFGVSREEFVGQARNLRRRMGELDEWGRALAFAQLVAGLNEGHTRLRRLERVLELRPNPVRLGRFADGWRVMASNDEAIVGERVVEIGDLPIDRAVAVIGRYIAGDNDFHREAVAGEYLIYPQALEASGIAKAGHGGRIVLEDSKGERHERLLDPGRHHEGSWKRLTCVSPEAVTPPSDANPYYWFRELDEGAAVYLRFNAFLDADGEPFERFCERLSGSFKGDGPGRLIVDLRSNEGGDGRLMRTFLHMVIRHRRLQEPGRLIVLIGPQTFSAAVSLGVLLERHAAPWFVGEPTGGRPNGHGNPTQFELPHTRLTLQCSSVYVRVSDPSDRRPCIWPDVTVAPTFEDCLSGKDPVLEAALRVNALPPLKELLSAGLAGSEEKGVSGEALAASYDAMRESGRWWYRDFEMALLELAEECRAAGDGAGEHALLARAVRDYGYSSDPHSAMGAALEATGQTEAALAAYERAFRRSHGDRRAAEGLTRLRKRLGRPIVADVLGGGG